MFCIEISRQVWYTTTICTTTLLDPWIIRQTEKDVKPFKDPEFTYRSPSFCHKNFRFWNFKSTQLQIESDECRWNSLLYITRSLRTFSVQSKIGHLGSWMYFIWADDAQKSLWSKKPPRACNKDHASRLSATKSKIFFAIEVKIYDSYHILCSIYHGTKWSMPHMICGSYHILHLTKPLNCNMHIRQKLEQDLSDTLNLSCPK